LDKIGKEILQ